MRSFFNIDRFLKVTRTLPMSVTKVPSKLEINRNWRRQILQEQQFSALVSPWLTNQSLKHSTFQPLSCSFLHKLSPIPPFSLPTFSSTRMRNPLVIIFFPLFQPFRFLSFFFGNSNARTRFPGFPPNYRSSKGVSLGHWKDQHDYEN